VYLITCSNPVDCKWELLQEIGLVLRKHGGPFILGGDFQMSSKTLAESGWLEFIGGKVVATGQDTYFSGMHSSELSYFVVHRDLAVGARCVKLDSLKIPKHDPVVWSFLGPVAMGMFPNLAGLPGFPTAWTLTTKLVANLPPSWEGFQEKTKLALESKQIWPLSKEWQEKAVGEVIDTLGVQHKFSTKVYTRPLRFKKAQAMLQCQAFIVGSIVATTWRHIAAKLHEYLKYSMLGQYLWALRVKVYLRGLNNIYACMRRLAG